MRLKYLAFLIPILFAVAFVSATTSYYVSSVVLNSTQPSMSVDFVNNGNQSVTLSYSSLPITINGSTNFMTIPAYVGGYFPISVINGATAGNYSGYIDFSDNSSPLPVSVSISGNTGPGPSSCQLYVNPYTSTYQITQGQSFTGTPIKITANNCPSLSFNSVTPSTGGSFVNIVSQGQSGQTYTFTLGGDTTGIPTGTYSNSYQISATDTSNNVYTTNNPVSVSVIVTQGTSPISNFTASNLPTCSLSSTALTLNQTYSLTCTNLNPNIQISPQSNLYLQGQGITLTSNAYTYNFIATTLGVTNVTANFLYQNAPVGQPFNQQISITSNGEQAGVGMDLVFNPDLSILNTTTSSQTFVIQCIDNATNNLVNDCSLYLNGVKEVNNSITLSPGNSYSLRAVASGYNNIVQTINFNPQQINLTLSPSPMIDGQLDLLTVSPADASVYIDGTSVALDGNGTANLTLTGGTHTISALLSGYVPLSQNITVLPQIAIASNTTWALNTQTVITLNRVANWTINYLKNPSSSYNQVDAGYGSQILYTPTASGTYEIFADGTNVGNGVIPQSPILVFFENDWLWVVIAVVVIIVLILIISAITKNSGGGVYMPRGGPNFLSPIGGGE